MIDNLVEYCIKCGCHRLAIIGTFASYSELRCLVCGTVLDVDYDDADDDDRPATDQELSDMRGETP